MRVYRGLNVKSLDFGTQLTVATASGSALVLVVGMGVLLFLLQDTPAQGRYRQAGLALAVAAAATVVLSSRLHGALSEPIRALTAAAHRVSKDGDYSVRVPEASAGDLATLTRAFNRMLQQIQEQDLALRATRDELEARVHERVQELRQEVDERHGVEGALRASQAQLKAVVESSNNLFYSHTPQHNVAYVSPQTRAFLDCTPEQAPMVWTEWLTDDPINAKGLEARDQAIRTGERQLPYELELQSATGRRVRVEVNEAPIVQGGRCVLVVGALTDITARKRAENDKARLEEALRQAHKMEAIGRLAGGIAHDFNNLLGVISGYGELLRRQLESESPYRSRLDQMMKAVERATALTRQILTFSRRQIVERKPLDLSAVVGDMEKMLRGMIGEDVELSVETEKHLGVVRADSTQIEQVVMNLAVNARDAMIGGGALRIALANREVTPRDGGAVAPGQYVVLQVADTGAGMDPGTLSHIFEPFFSTKGRGKGTGLGLATVYGIVQQSGGSIAVESRTGQGTTFRIYLPRVDELVPGIVERVPAARGGRETVLLVEDEPSLREMVAESLTEAGYTVLAASGGMDALAQAHSHSGPIHLMLSDVIMPGLGGRELAERIRLVRPATRVMFMSGYSDEVIARRGQFVRGMILLRKPFNHETLLASLRDALGAGVALAEKTALTA